MSKYLLPYTKLTKAVFPIVFLFMQSSFLFAQSTEKNIVAITSDDLKFKGKLIDETPDKIIILLDVVNDVISLDKALIKIYYDVNDKHKIFFEDGRYHRKTGWINSIGFHIGNLANVGTAATSGVGQNPSILSAYTLYKMIKPNLAIGAGIAAKGLPTRELGYEHFTYYKFYDLYAYGKFYFNNNRRRLYVDTKIGYSRARSGIRYSCPYCDISRTLKIDYSSGPMIQPGIGIEFARVRRVRSGIQLSTFYNYSTVDADSYNNRKEEVTQNSKRQVFAGLLIGLNFYY